MNVLSLFSGIGGFDLGFERAGMTVVGVCEIDKHAQKILQRHFPAATLHTDVREVHYERGTVDVICGGFPCQDLSVAGKRRGLAGERSGLWHEFARIIDETEPAWVVIENVPGLFSSAGGRDFAVIIQWLAQRGYGVGWRVLDAQGFGLAQRRKRVFIVGSFGNPSGCTILLEPESVQGNYQSSGKTGKSHSRTAQNSTRNGIAFTLRGTSGIQNGDGAINTNIVPDTIAQTLTTHEGRTQFYDYSTLLPTTYAIEGHLIDRKTSQNGIGIAENAPMYTLTSTDRHGVGVVGLDVLWECDHTDIPARICKDQECAPTLKSRMGTGGNNIPLVGVRRLTPTECERLQGFPDGWTDGQADSHRYKQLGNAVAVPVAEWIGRRMKEVHNDGTI